MKVKKVLRLQRDIARFRLFRVIYDNGRKAVSFSLCLKLYGYHNCSESTIVTFFCIRVNYHKPNGGIKC
jgi:hypothetical protein